MDLTVMHMSTMGALLCLGFHSISGIPWGWSIFLASLSGVAIGSINGLLVTRFKIHSFIVTLGMQFVLKGSCTSTPAAPSCQSAGLRPQRGAHRPRGPAAVLCLLCDHDCGHLPDDDLPSLHAHGRNIYMVGGNLESAWLAGIKSNSVTPSPSSSRPRPARWAARSTASTRAPPASQWARRASVAHDRAHRLHHRRHIDLRRQGQRGLDLGIPGGQSRF